MDETVWGKFASEINLTEDIEEIGKGSFGQVFKVRKKNSENESPETEFFALKMTILKSEEEMLNENEGRAYKEIKKLRNDNHVVKQYEQYSMTLDMNVYGHLWLGSNTLDTWAGSEGSSKPDGFKTSSQFGFFKFFLMELCKWSLHDYLATVKKEELEICTIDHSAISQVFTDITTGLIELDRKGVMHRDIKPRNILQGLDGYWKIGDFGLCTLDPTKEEGSTERFDLTMTKSMQKFVGTDLYRAPEIGISPERYSSKVDIFSLGQTYIKIIISHENFTFPEKILADIIHGENRAWHAYLKLGAVFTKCGMTNDHVEFAKLLTNRNPEDRPSAKEALEKFGNLPEIPLEVKFKLAQAEPNVFLGEGNATNSSSAIAVANDSFAASQEGFEDLLIEPQVVEPFSCGSCCCKTTTSVKTFAWMDIVFGDGQFHSLANIQPRIPTLICDGASKRYLVPGWRIGWIVLRDRDGALGPLWEKLGSMAHYINGPCRLAQATLGTLLKETPSSYFDDLNVHLAKSSEIICNELVNCNGLTIVKPQGGTSCLILVNENFFGGKETTAESFVVKLIEQESVYVHPGAPLNCPMGVRMNLCHDHDSLREACKRMKEFCTRNYVS